MGRKHNWECSIVKNKVQSGIYLYTFKTLLKLSQFIQTRENIKFESDFFERCFFQEQQHLRVAAILPKIQYEQKSTL